MKIAPLNKRQSRAFRSVDVIFHFILHIPANKPAESLRAPGARAARSFAQRAERDWRQAAARRTPTRSQSSSGRIQGPTELYWADWRRAVAYRFCKQNSAEIIEILRQNRGTLPREPALRTRIVTCTARSKTQESACQHRRTVPACLNPGARSLAVALAPGRLPEYRFSRQRVRWCSLRLRQGCAHVGEDCAHCRCNAVDGGNERQ